MRQGGGQINDEPTGDVTISDFPATKKTFQIKGGEVAKAPLEDNMVIFVIWYLTYVDHHNNYFDYRDTLT